MRVGAQQWWWGLNDVLVVQAERMVNTVQGSGIGGGESKLLQSERTGEDPNQNQMNVYI